ncbi:MAG TPA: hypothetical protein VGZ23_12205 [bacterium]|nr:hypothetical protein [bacterium]
MIVQAVFHIHPDNKEKAKAEIRKIKAIIAKHGGRNLKYYASVTSETPNRMFVYEVDKLAHFDTLGADPDFRDVKLDSLYADAAMTFWAEVEV